MAGPDAIVPSRPARSGWIPPAGGKEEVDLWFGRCPQTRVRGGFEVFAGLLDEEAGIATTLDTPRKGIGWVREEPPVDEADLPAAAFLACY
jgi:hypothetical protein